MKVAKNVVVSIAYQVRTEELPQVPYGWSWFPYGQEEMFHVILFKDDT